MTNVLFLCARNRLRSPTAEAVFADWPGTSVASAGLSRDADNPLTPDLVDWADLVFVMEQAHRRKLTGRFSAKLKNKRVVCLHIRDDYELMQPALLELLTQRVSPHLPPR